VVNQDFHPALLEAHRQPTAAPEVSVDDKTQPVAENTGSTIILPPLIRQRVPVLLLLGSALGNASDIRQ
jgi:hypothetical protein